LIADPAVADGGAHDGFLEDFHLGVGVVGKVEGGRLDDGGFFGGAEFVFAVVGEDAVADLRREDGREALDLLDLLVDHLTADDDVADELALLGVVVLGEGGELADLADVVEKGDADEEVALEEGIALAVEVAELGDAEGVLTEAADKAMVDGFGGGGHLEGLDEFLILHKEHFQESVEVGIFDGVHELQDGLEHVVDAALGDGQVVGGVVFALVAESGPADVELEVSLVGDDLSGDFHVVHLAEFADAHTVGIPDLGIDGACLVLEGQGLVVFPGPGDHGLSLLAEVDFPDTASVLEFIDIVHVGVYSLSIDNLIFDRLIIAIRY